MGEPPWHEEYGVAGWMGRLFPHREDQAANQLAEGNDA